MDYTIEDIGSAAVVRFGGDLGGVNDADLKKLFLGLCQDGRANAVADMRKVEFMDSTVIGLFVWGAKNLREVGGDWRLFGLTRAVSKIFDVTMLDKSFQIFPSESEAVASYA